MRLADLKNLLDKHNTILILFISFISITPRLILTLKQGWLADEIYHVDFIGNWFLHNFWDYFFQFRHEFYPPKSPVFGNPPLAMWLMTFGMWITEKLGPNTLIGARIINNIFGTATTVLIYLIGWKLFNSKILGVIGALFYALSPLAIAIDASAYLDTTLSFFLLVNVYLLFRFIDTSKLKYLNLLGINLGLSILVKLYALYLIVPILVYVLLVCYKKKLLGDYLLFIGLLVFVPMTMWAGFRDMGHVASMFSWINQLSSPKIGMMAPYQDVSGALEGPYYYYLIMLLGKMTSITSILFLITIFYFVYQIYRIWRAQNKIKGINLAETDFKAITLIFLILFPILGYTVRPGVISTIHSTSFILPLIFISDAYILIKLCSLSNQLKIIKKINAQKLQSAVIIVVLLLNIIPLVTWDSKFYNAYSNGLIGGVQGGSNLYRIGDGEGLEIIGKWVMENTSYSDKIGVIRYTYILDKYVMGRTYDVPINWHIDNIFGENIKYLVIHNSHVSGGLLPPILEEINTLKIDPIFVMYVNRYPYISVYEFNASQYFLQKKDLALLPLNRWAKKAKSNNTLLNIKIEASEKLTLNYELTKKDEWAYILTEINSSDISDSDGIKVDIYGDNNKENLYFSFESTEEIYLRKKIKIDFEGWRTFYIPFNSMEINYKQDLKKDLNNTKYFKISLEGSEQASGEIFLKDFKWIDKNY